jgi:hypothetical protein
VAVGGGGSAPLRPALRHERQGRAEQAAAGGGKHRRKAGAIPAAAAAHQPPPAPPPPVRRTPEARRHVGHAFAPDPIISDHDFVPRLEQVGNHGLKAGVVW